jgi:putative FmdB family regulatory protein
MPTYQYQCGNCGHEFEILQSMKDEKLTECPECGEKALRRLIGSGSGLIFKGSGFYLTDYVKKGNSGTGDTNSSKKEKDKESSKPTETTSKPESTKPASGSADSSSPKKSSD